MNSCQPSTSQYPQLCFDWTETLETQTRAIDATVRLLLGAVCGKAVTAITSVEAGPQLSDRGPMLVSEKGTAGIPTSQNEVHAHETLPGWHIVGIHGYCHREAFSSSGRHAE